MRFRYLKKNLQDTKKALEKVACDYRCHLKMEVEPNRPVIWLTFTRKYEGWKFIKIVELPEDKIAYGKYRPGMVAYNVGRQLSKWLKGCYECVYRAKE